MRVLLLSSPKFQIPMEQAVPMTQAFVEWREQYRDKMEVFFFYAGRNGGGGILNVADEEELNSMVLDWPFAPVSDTKVIPIIDGDVGLRQWQSVMEKMAQRMEQ